MIMSIVMLMGMGTRWVPATHGGYGYGFVCPLGTLPTTIPTLDTCLCFVTVVIYSNITIIYFKTLRYVWSSG